MSEPLMPQHRSMVDRRRKPSSLDSIVVTDEQRVTVQALALDVFTTCANAGYSFAKCLATVYLTGLENGASASIASTPPTQPAGDHGLAVYSEALKVKPSPV